MGRNEVMRRSLVKALNKQKIQNAICEIISHKKSIGKVASECEISVWEILDLLKERNVDWTNYKDDDIEKDFNLTKRYLILH